MEGLGVKLVSLFEDFIRAVCYVVPLSVVRTPSLVIVIRTSIVIIFQPFIWFRLCVSLFKVGLFQMDLMFFLSYFVFDGSSSLLLVKAPLSQILMCDLLEP